MPRISAFCGIVITMNYREHGYPHIHARHGDRRALIAAGRCEPCAVGCQGEVVVVDGDRA